MARSATSNRSVNAALIGNMLVAVTKFAAAAVTGSSAMLSEGIHSLVDCGNELLLIYGLRRAAMPADRLHPLGHGRELYFWSFVVAVLVFALGAGVSLFEGITRVLHPQPVENALVSYIVLGLSVLFEAASWRVALSEFRRSKGDRGYIEALTYSKDPATFIVLLEDTAALIGLVIAFAGIFSAEWFGLPALDAVGSIGIGLVLAVTAIFLARETKALLIGEQASPGLEASILKIAGEDPGLREANGVLTVQLAPTQVVAALSAEFQDEMTAPEIERCVERIEGKVRQQHPEIVRLFFKPQTTALWRERQARLAANSR